MLSFFFSRSAPSSPNQVGMSGMMTPESLSREGSPTPPGVGMGEITLHAAPPHNVSAQVSVGGSGEPMPAGPIVDILHPPAAVLTSSQGHPITVTQPFNLARPAHAGSLHLQPQKLIVAAAAGPAGPLGAPATVQPIGHHPPRLLVPAQQVTLLQTTNGAGGPTATTHQLNSHSTSHSLEVKKEGLYKNTACLSFSSFSNSYSQKLKYRSCVNRI